MYVSAIGNLVIRANCFDNLCAGSVLFLVPANVAGCGHRLYHVLLCLRDKAPKGSPAIPLKSMAFGPGSRLLSISMWPACAEPIQDRCIEFYYYIDWN